MFTNFDPFRHALVSAGLDLVHGRPQHLSVAQARLLKLDAWCYFNAAPASAYRHELAAEFAYHWQAQSQRALALMPLLQAWQREGIRPVAIKGFAMAWAVYPHPATRFFGDVDFLLERHQVERALRVEVPGWRLYRVAQGGDGREAFVAFHQVAGVAVDVQVGLLSEFGFPAVQNKQLTAQVLAAAQQQIEVSVGQATCTVRALAPADMLLLLAVNRAWTGDAWRNKPHDYLDMALVIERYGLRPEDVAQRAAQLGIAATWTHFLKHCNAFEGHLDLVSTRYKPFTRLRNDLCLASTGKLPRLNMLFSRARRAPRVLWRAAQVVPTLLGVVADLRKYPTPAAASAVPASSTLVPDQPQWQAWEAEQACRWAKHLLRPVCRLTDAGPCVVHSLTLFRLLQKRGHKAQWCLGYRLNENNPVIGHAWVECEDASAFGPGPPIKNALYRVVFRRESSKPVLAGRAGQVP